MGAGQYELQPLYDDNNNNINSSSVASGGLAQSHVQANTAWYWVSATLACVCSLLVVAVALMYRQVYVLRKRPRIRRRIVVNKNVTPLTTCPPLPQDQCEITIENCCNMNICETVSTYTSIYINANFNCSCLRSYCSYGHLR